MFVDFFFFTQQSQKFSDSSKIFMSSNMYIICFVKKVAILYWGFQFSNSFKNKFFLIGNILIIKERKYLEMKSLKWGEKGEILSNKIFRWANSEYPRRERFILGNKFCWRDEWWYQEGKTPGPPPLVILLPKYLSSGRMP